MVGTLIKRCLINIIWTICLFILTVDWHQCHFEDVEVTRQSSWGFNYPKQYFSIFCEPFWCWVLNLVCMLVQSTSFRCKSHFFKLISQGQESTRQKKYLSAKYHVNIFQIGLSTLCNVRYSLKGIWPVLISKLPSQCSGVKIRKNVFHSFSRLKEKMFSVHSVD